MIYNDVHKFNYNLKILMNTFQVQYHNSENYVVHLTQALSYFII